MFGNMEIIKPDAPPPPPLNLVNEMKEGEWGKGAVRHRNFAQYEPAFFYRKGMILYIFMAIGVERAFVKRPYNLERYTVTELLPKGTKIQFTV